MKLQLSILSVFIAITSFLSICTLQAASISTEEAEAIAIEAYIYGYPLMTMEKVKQVMTNVPHPEGLRAPVGQFVHARGYPNAYFKDMTAPNADTLYSFAWLDLSKEPYILHVPDENDRYYLMPILDGWTNVIGGPSTRTTGTNPADFAIVGPGWTGTLPPGVKEYKSPTNLVSILGRTYCSGTPEDYKAVHKIQDQYSLVPLSSYGDDEYTPPEGKVDASINMKSAVSDQIDRLDGVTYFKLLASLLKSNPPVAADAPIVAKLAKIGIVPGKDFDISILDKNILKAMEVAPKLAHAKIMSHQIISGRQENGWNFSTKTGVYGTDYIQRAYIASTSLGASFPEDSIYPVARVDSQGLPLSGANSYIIRFPKGQTPPVKGFWSLTMYNNQYFFIDNPLNRYTLSPRNPLKYDQDGSLTLYIQYTNPGADKESNWLPSPKDGFILMLRLFWPQESALVGTWKPPAIDKVP